MTCYRHKKAIAPNRRMRKILLRFTPWVGHQYHNHDITKCNNPKFLWYYRDHLDRKAAMERAFSCDVQCAS